MQSRAKITNTYSSGSHNQIKHKTNQQQSQYFTREPHLQNRLFSFAELQEPVNSLDHPIQQSLQSLNIFCNQFIALNQLIEIDSKNNILAQILMFNTWDKTAIEETLVEQATMKNQKLSEHICERMTKYLRIFETFGPPIKINQNQSPQKHSPMTPSYTYHHKMKTETTGIKGMTDIKGRTTISIESSPQDIMKAQESPTKTEKSGNLFSSYKQKQTQKRPIEFEISIQETQIQSKTKNMKSSSYNRQNTLSNSKCKSLTPAHNYNSPNFRSNQLKLHKVQKFNGPPSETSNSSINKKHNEIGFSKNTKKQKSPSINKRSSTNQELLKQNQKVEQKQKYTISKRNTKQNTVQNSKKASRLKKQSRITGNADSNSSMKRKQQLSSSRSNISNYSSRQKSVSVSSMRGSTLKNRMGSSRFKKDNDNGGLQANKEQNRENTGVELRNLVEQTVKKSECFMKMLKIMQNQ